MKESQEKLISKIKGDFSNTNSQFELSIIYQTLHSRVAGNLFFLSTRDRFIWSNTVSQCVTN